MQKSAAAAGDDVQRLPAREALVVMHVPESKNAGRASVSSPSARIIAVPVRLGEPK